MNHNYYSIYIDCILFILFSKFFERPIFVSLVSLNFLDILRMRELNEDGTLKDAAVILLAAGFQLGDWVERRADKARGKLFQITNESVKLEVEGSPDIIAAFPLKEFLTKQWVKTTAKQEPVEFIPTGPMESFEAFVAARVAALIQAEVCSLSTLHEEMVLSTKVCVKPVKGVQCCGDFGKGKLTLVPTTIKVNYKAGNPPNGAAQALVQPRSPTSFWLGAVHLPKAGEEGMMVPFWHLQRSDEDFNMEIVYIKFTHGTLQFKIPVAQNIKAVKAGEWLTLRKLETTIQEPVKGDAKIQVQLKPKAKAEAAAKKKARTE